ncbi:PASTA domain-containing protein [Lentzea sp. NPDC006480]|uniref:PASTA domain-containing protein n=1 Tax=Lentzea sp. NPDC006480 TaxID=3157176 RepID=UPI0033A625C9
MKILIAVLLLALAGCTGAEPPGRGPVNEPAVSSDQPASKMPKVSGLRLSEARDVLLVHGYRVTEEDATGQNRPVLEPSNWVVVAQSPEADAEAPNGSRVVLKLRKPTDPSTSQEPAAKGTVPNVVCLDLQKAQDTLQAAGFYLLGSEDATGQGRQQLVDRNWVVVSQSAPAGSTPDPKTKITLGAVKFGEPTGASGCQS